MKRVTLLSKVLAMFVFIVFPFGGFWLGVKYQKGIAICSQESIKLVGKKENKFINTAFKYEITIPDDYEREETNINSNDMVRFVSTKGERHVLTIRTILTEEKTIQDYLNKTDKVMSTAWEGQPAARILKTQKTQINGESTIIRQKHLLAADFPSITADFLKNGYIYEIEWQLQGKSEISVADERKMKEIVSTFRFMGI